MKDREALLIRSKIHIIKASQFAIIGRYSLMRFFATASCPKKHDGIDSALTGGKASKHSHDR